MGETQVDLDHISHFFSENGPLASTIDGYEKRDEQTQIATQVAKAINEGADLVAEAGTGTGKTLAYLVPALASGLRVVISTGTKTLQDQIIKKELPLLQRAAGKTFSVQLMKGRSNYLCHLRAGRFSQQPYLPTMPDQKLYERISAWQTETNTGDRSELKELPDNSSIWTEVSATPDQCTGRRCGDYERCWVTQMRRSAQNSQLIVVNHHLYFADAMVRSQLTKAQAGDNLSVIPTHDLVIFDEAHDLDEIAAQHFGIQVSDKRIVELTRDLSKAINHNALLLAKFSSTLTALEIKSRKLFECIQPKDAKEPFLPHHVDDELLGRFAQVDELLGILEADLALLDNEDLAPFGRRCSELSAQLAFLLYQPGRSGLLSAIERPHTPAAAMNYQRIPDELPNPTNSQLVDDDGERSRPPVPYVRFTESSSRSKAIIARPLDVAPLMEYTLSEIPSVFISATLTVKGSFEHYKSRVGLYEDEAVQQSLVESPFDYTQQVKLYIPPELPEPNHPEFASAAAQKTIGLIEASGGGAFVLCTSHKMVQVFANALETKTPFRVLLQGQAPRTHLLDAFRNDGHAVLVATISFWQGIDVPGAALRQVIIDKLPFASPGDPVVAAKLDYIKSMGKSPFGKYQLPQAAIMLRQGFGRLIRRKTDQGLISILDNRIAQKSYGKVFMKSLPTCPIINDENTAFDYLNSLGNPRQ